MRMRGLLPHLTLGDVHAVGALLSAATPAGMSNLTRKMPASMTRADLRADEGRHGLPRTAAAHKLANQVVLVQLEASLLLQDAAL